MTIFCRPSPERDHFLSAVIFSVFYRVKWLLALKLILEGGGGEYDHPCQCHALQKRIKEMSGGEIRAASVPSNE